MSAEQLDLKIDDAIDRLESKVDREEGYQDSVIELLAFVEENNPDSDSASGLEKKYYPLKQKPIDQQDAHELSEATAVLTRDSFTVYDHSLRREDAEKDERNFVARINFGGDTVEYQVGSEVTDADEAKRKIDDIIERTFVAREHYDGL